MAIFWTVVTTLAVMMAIPLVIVGLLWLSMDKLMQNDA
jgi:hypothetical protein